MLEIKLGFYLLLLLHRHPREDSLDIQEFILGIKCNFKRVFENCIWQIQMQRSEEHSPPDNFEWELSLFLLFFVEVRWLLVALTSRFFIEF